MRSRRGIPFVWFPDPARDHAEGWTHYAALVGEVKDIRSGEQLPADPAEWNPPLEDLHPAVIGVDPAAG